MAHRRLAVLCGHLHQVDRGPPRTLLSPTHCHGDGEKGSSRSEKDCIFCKIVRGESPAFKLYEDNICMCILDSHPLTRGHSLIIPKLHFSSLGVTSPTVIAAMFSKVPFLSNAIMKATQCETGSYIPWKNKFRVYNNLQTSAADSYNLLVNNGVAAGQVIFHTHLHIIPRRADDKLWTTESGFKRKPLKLNQDTDALAHCVRELVSLPPEDGDNCEIHELKVGFNSSD